MVQFSQFSSKQTAQEESEIGSEEEVIDISDNESELDSATFEGNGEIEFF